MQVKIGKKHNKPGAVCVGLSIPHGASDKGELKCLEKAMEVLGLKTLVVSIDSFLNSKD